MQVVFEVEQIFLTKNALIVVGLELLGNVGTFGGVGGLVIVEMAGCWARLLKALLLQPVVPLVQLSMFSVCDAVLLYCTTGVCRKSRPTALQMFLWATIPVPGSMKPTFKFAHLVLTPFATQL